MLLACFVLLFVFGARLGLALGGACACCVCLCAVVRFYCSARLGFWDFSVVRLLLVILCFRCALGFRARRCVRAVSACVR